MEFEEMKKIWDSQNNEPIYVIDEQTLHRKVIRKNMGIKRMAGMTELSFIAISLGLALVMIAKGFIDNEMYKLPQGIIFGLIAGFIYWSRTARIKAQGESDRTLLGDLEQALRTIDYHIKRERNFVWWFLLPATVTVVINFIYSYEGKPWWIWPVTLGAFALSYWVIKRGLRTKIMPGKEDLESLRSLLLETRVKKP